MSQAAQSLNLIRAKTDTVTSYSVLKAQVRKVIALGQARAEAALRREKVRTAWEVGRLIIEHVLLNQARAGYGDKVILRLSGDLGMNKRNVQYMIEFARAYPIVPTSAQLSWSHYRELLTVDDVQERKVMTKRAEKENWPVVRLRSAIRSQHKKESKAAKKNESLEPVVPGALNVFRVRVVNGQTLIDLGFSTYVEKRNGKQKLKIVKDRNFTYSAKVEKVVDGDTIWCVVDLGLGVKTRQKLRLRAVNAAEINTQEGRRAKRYLARKLPRGMQFTLSSSKSDKFDRYLADIWVGRYYVNQQLVRAGHALVV